MTNISKQDRQGARTPADLERKYNFKQSFAQVSGFAAEARRAAEQAEQAADEINDVFTRDIVFTGTLTNTVEGYLPPGKEEIDTLQAHITGVQTIPEDLQKYYDFNGDGVLNSLDGRKAQLYYLGIEPFAEWPMAQKSQVTLTIDLTDTEKAIHFTGTNMWGREVDAYIGVNLTSVINPATEERLKLLEERVAALEAQGG